MLAGGIGGTSGDILMHSLDTVKTRQQGDPHWPPRYRSLGDAYLKIFRQEGFRRGLYGGFSAAMLGSFPGTVVFFGCYELCKRSMLDHGINPSVSFLTSGLSHHILCRSDQLTLAGFLADFAASVLYVPSEVLKTRLQLQGRYNNPFFHSGYNYKSTWDAARTIARTEGVPALYSGYKATIVRDLPFSAIQFALYEQFRRLALQATNAPDLSFGLEVLTAVSAGGIAGVVTCPLDVVKTRVQTQITPGGHDHSSQSSRMEKLVKAAKGQKRSIHSGPRTVPNTVTTLDTSSIMTGLKIIYKTEGVGGMFRGVGPRFVWTSVQSGTMLVMYQYLLKNFERFASETENVI